MKPETVLLDSCVLLDIFQKTSQFHEVSLALIRKLIDQKAKLVVNDLACAELMPFFRDKNKMIDAVSKTGAVIQTHTLDDACCAGEMRADLAERMRGPIKGKRYVIDLMIAAHARRLGALATRDADFEPVERIYKLKIYWA